jgi:tRNA A37 threonylcarbamoyladenosine synthetase subunit TsaC/SUA5/YrdC
VVSINEAIRTFKDQIDFYLDAGQLDNAPSKVIRIIDGKEIILRS